MVMLKKRNISGSEGGIFFVWLVYPRGLLPGMASDSVYLSCAVCLLGFSVNYCRDDACMLRGVFVGLSVVVERESYSS
jgi:hypothetical protein